MHPYQQPPRRSSSRNRFGTPPGPMHDDGGRRHRR
jgi:hypothetical protein